MEIALATAGIVQGSGQIASEPEVELAHGGQLVTEGEISRTATVSWLTGPPRGLGHIGGTSSMTDAFVLGGIRTPVAR
jgi:hypothetical protein